MSSLDDELTDLESKEMESDDYISSSSFKSLDEEAYEVADIRKPLHSLRNELGKQIVRAKNQKAREFYHQLTTKIDAICDFRYLRSKSLGNGDEKK